MSTSHRVWFAAIVVATIFAAWWSRDRSIDWKKQRERDLWRERAEARRSMTQEQVNEWYSNRFGSTNIVK